MDYRVLTAPDLATLTAEVKQALNAGWKLAGGVAVIATDKSGSGYEFMQAVTK